MARDNRQPTGESSLVNAKLLAERAVLNAILEDYKKKYQCCPWYEDLYKGEDPKITSKGLELSFPNEEELICFAQEQAGKGLSFTVINPENNQVIGYSDGRAFHSIPKDQQVHYDKFKLPGTVAADPGEKHGQGHTANPRW